MSFALSLDLSLSPSSSHLLLPFPPTYTRTHTRTHTHASSYSSIALFFFFSFSSPLSTILSLSSPSYLFISLLYSLSLIRHHLYLFCRPITCSSLLTFSFSFISSTFPSVSSTDYRFSLSLCILSILSPLSTIISISCVYQLPFLLTALSLSSLPRPPLSLSLLPITYSSYFTHAILSPSVSFFPMLSPPFLHPKASLVFTRLSTPPP